MYRLYPAIMNEWKILQEIGIPEKEASVYITLLELGEATAGAIAKKTKFFRSNVYELLDKLIQRGLASYILKEEKKYYKATDPEFLMKLWQEKKNLLESILPKLKLLENMAQVKSNVHIYEGKKALQNLLNSWLERGLDRVVFGVPANAMQILGQAFIEDYHKRRIAKKIRLWHIYNIDAKERIKTMNALPYTETRYLPQEYNSPVATSIAGDEVALTLYEEPPITILIKNAKIARTYRRYFDLLWSLAKKD